MTQRPGAAEYLVNAHSMIVKKAKSSSETERKLNAKQHLTFVEAVSQ